MSNEFNRYQLLEVLTPAECVSRMLDASTALDEAQRNLRDALHFEAAAEQEYREAKAKAWTELPDMGTAAMKEAIVQGQSAKARRVRDDAVAESKAWMEEVRNKRQVLSALQSVANSIKEEAALARTGPSVEGFMG